VQRGGREAAHRGGEWLEVGSWRRRRTVEVSREASREAGGGSAHRGGWEQGGEKRETLSKRRGGVGFWEISFGVYSPRPSNACLPGKAEQIARGGLLHF
jgi:hypothetical protein